VVLRLASGLHERANCIEDMPTDMADNLAADAGCSEEAAAKNHEQIATRHKDAEDQRDKLINIFNRFRDIIYSHCRALRRSEK